MYELPGMKNVEKVVVDESVIEGTSKPVLVYADSPRVSGGNS